MKKCFLLILLVVAMAVSACATPSPDQWTATATTSSSPTKPSIPTLTPEPTSEPYVIVDVPMYVRNGPGSEFNVIGEIESQKKYLVIGKHVDWWLVDLGNHQSGWINALADEIIFFGNADAVADLVSPPTPTSEIIPACTPADQPETPSEGLKKARKVLLRFFELLNQQEYEKAAGYMEEITKVFEIVIRY